MTWRWEATRSVRSSRRRCFSPAEVAELLQVEEEVVTELADEGELPGRMLGDEWRFSRTAVLEWLGAEG